MSFISSILAPFKWLANKIAGGVKTGAPIAVTITETVKTILANPVAGFLENIIDSVTGTGIAVSAANAINAEIPKILTAELAIEGLPNNPTQADVLAFEQRVLGVFDVNTDNSRLYTVLGAQIYGIINTTATSGKPITFAVLVADIEEAYQDYKADLAANVPLSNASVSPSNASTKGSDNTTGTANGSSNGGSQPTALGNTDALSGKQTTAYLASQPNTSTSPNA